MTSSNYSVRAHERTLVLINIAATTHEKVPTVCRRPRYFITGVPRHPINLHYLLKCRWGSVCTSQEAHSIRATFRSSALMKMSVSNVMRGSSARMSSMIDRKTPLPGVPVVPVCQWVYMPSFTLWQAFGDSSKKSCMVSFFRSLNAADGVSYYSDGRLRIKVVYI